MNRNDESVIDEEEEELHKYSPRIDSPDPNERKLARRLRIKRRIENSQRLTLASKESFLIDEIEEDDKEQKDKVQRQIKKAVLHLEKLIAEAEEQLKEVPAINQQREMNRRKLTETRYRETVKKLEEEAIFAKTNYVNILEKYKSFEKFQDPLPVQEGIDSILEDFKIAVNRKDQIIAMLKDKLYKAEKEYGKAQAIEMEEYQSLAGSLENQLTAIKQAFKEEILAIENVLIKERSIFINRNQKNLEELHRRRAQQETDNVEFSQKLLKQSFAVMKDIRLNFQEKLRSTKIKYESYCQDVQRELLKIKAESLLNSEKVDYNNQILRRREAENKILKSQQKRRINKLQELIMYQRITNKKTKIKSDQEIETLRCEVEKLKQNILDLEEKADHFALVNDNQFHAIWDMNVKNAKKMWKSIQDTDKIIHEQILGLEWVLPQNILLKKEQLPSFQLGLQLVLEKFTRAKWLQMKEASQNKDKLEEWQSSQNYKRLVDHILKITSARAGFLSDVEIKDLLSPYLDQELDVIKIDNLMTALQLDKETDLDELEKYFDPYITCNICMEVASQNKTLQSSSGTLFSGSQFLNKDYGLSVTDFITDSFRPSTELSEIISTLVVNASTNKKKPVLTKCAPPSITDGEESEDLKKRKKYSKVSLSIGGKASIQEENAKDVCRHYHPLTISRIDVTKALKEFVQGYFKREPLASTMKERLKFKRKTTSRLLSAEDISQFWRRFKYALPKERIELWDQVIAGLRSYHEILNLRKDYNEDVISLRALSEKLASLTKTTS